MTTKRLRKKKTKEFSLCPLCGKKLPEDPYRQVVGKTGRAVCGHCLTISQHVLEAVPSEKEKAPCGGIVTPQEMMVQLDKRIIGQEEAKRAVALALWKQQLRARGEDIPNSSLLLYGPTGCGKTALIREAAKIAGLPYVCFDATSLTETGYKGQHANEMVVELVERYGIEQSRYGVIFLDEADKLAAFQGNEHRAVYSRGTQHSLLKLIEGSTVRAEGEPFETDGILFVFGGAFSSLCGNQKQASRHACIGFEREMEEASPERVPDVDDFIGYGMEPELMGRIGQRIALHALTVEDLRCILLESELSVFRKYQKFFRQRNIDLAMGEDEIRLILQKAESEGLGARGLNTLVEAWVAPKLLCLAEGWNL